MMNAQAWYYKNGDSEVGPVSPGELRKLVENGGVLPGDLVRREDWAEGRVASSIKGLLSLIHI